MEQPEEILIDEKTRVMIRDLVGTINELHGRLQIIMQIVVNCNGLDGNYRLSDDLAKFIRIKE